MSAGNPSEPQNVTGADLERVIVRHCQADAHAGGHAGGSSDQTALRGIGTRAREHLDATKLLGGIRVGS